MGSEPPVYDSDDAWVYIHSYLSVLSFNYTVSIEIVSTYLMTTWKASKSCPSHSFSDLLCVLCSHRLILAPPVPVHVQYLKVNRLKNRRFTILMMRELYSPLSLNCIYYLYRVCWNSANVSDDDMKSVKSMSRSLLFWFVVRIVLTPSDSSTTRPCPRAASRGKPSEKPAVYNSDDAWVIFTLVSPLYLLLIPFLLE